MRVPACVCMAFYFMAADSVYDKEVYKGCTVCGIYTAAVPFVGYVRRVSQSDDIYS